ncbi:MAG: hypothetical protein NTY19_26040 [Planctomycetota bacterium]|nr:hypothetical protein [Planctomycetota bacterium]
MSKAQRAAVSKRAIIQRINRKLAPMDRKLKALRSQRWQSDLGDYYVVDLPRNFVVDSHIDLEAYGRELGALAAWETLAAE